MNLQRPALPDRQRGMIVVSTLALVAILAILAGAMLARQAVDTRRLEVQQQILFVRSTLAADRERARALLRLHSREQVAVRLDDPSNRPVRRRALHDAGQPPAWLYSRISDEQGKFNLRNLVRQGQVDPQESAAFLRLCQLLGIPAAQARQIARRAVISLVSEDRDQSVLTEQDRQASLQAGLELGFASVPAQDQAPRPRILLDLLPEPGLDEALLERLGEFVTILPRPSWINANTARAEVIAAWVPGLSLDKARALLAERDKGRWFLNRGDIHQRLNMPELEESQLKLGITSHWFRLDSAVRLQNAWVLSRALLFDDKQRLPQIVWHREGA
ncbi:type II secretion system minor pseudopilin GspK [Alcaligenes sp. Marseille-Q7550]